MAARPPKEKRRNSEKRKEKSRDAARCRRSKESEIFSSLSQLLPLPSNVSSQLDKASIMRLTIAYLKARTLLDNMHEGQLDFEDDIIVDSCTSQALGGVLIVLSADGDIVYLTDNVTQQLGLPQVDLIGQSIYDYSHPCDHDELRDALSAKPADAVQIGDPQARSLFLRLKSTLAVKGKSSNLKSASYKVMSCTGRIVRTAPRPYSSLLDRTCDSDDLSDNDFIDEKLKSTSPVQQQTHFLVLMGEPIPHPSNIEMPLDGHTFLTKHSLDMKYSYVDEKVLDFLGYSANELEGQSAYNFHHVLDNEAILRSYKTLFSKGQMQTPPYRFVHRSGGYTWVRTQATLVYGSSRETRPQAVVCVHTCLSEVEDEEHIMCVSQTGSVRPVAIKESVPAPLPVPVCVSAPPPSRVKPQKMTSKLIHPKTADMDNGFLMFDDLKGTVLKEEVEDLTHLAPTAGDACIPLDMPLLTLPVSFPFDPVSSPDAFDCFPLTTFEFSDVVTSPDGSDDMDSASSPINMKPFKEDPFFYLDSADQTSSLATSTASLSSQKSSSSRSSTNGEEDLVAASPSCSSPMEQTSIDSCLLLNDEEELNRRAPFIPMNDEEDLPVFSNTMDLFSGIDLDNLPLLSQSELDGSFESSTIRLLQQAEAQYNRKSIAPACNPLVPSSGPSFRAQKRPSIKADDADPKRSKCSLQPVIKSPSRGATSSLMELLQEKVMPVVKREQTSDSVLKNLLNTLAAKLPERPLDVSSRSFASPLADDASSFFSLDMELTDKEAETAMPALVDANDFFNDLELSAEFCGSVD